MICIYWLEKNTSPHFKKVPINNCDTKEFINLLCILYFYKPVENFVWMNVLDSHGYLYKPLLGRLRGNYGRKVLKKDEWTRILRQWGIFLLHTVPA